MITPATPTPVADAASTSPIVEAALAGHVRGKAGEDDSLVKAGLDSLAIVRIVLAVMGSDADGEIELGDIGTLRTVGDLRRHLSHLVGHDEAGVAQS